MDGKAAQAKQNILFLCDYQAPYGGNFLASMVKLDAALKARGAGTLYVFPAGAAKRPWYEPWTAGGRETRLLPEGSLAAQARFLTELVDACAVTVLHVHFGYFPLAELTALRRRRLRLVLHYHSDFSAGRKPTLGDALRHGVRSAVEGCIGKKRITKITVSEASARTTADCLSIPNALVTERFTPEIWEREETRAALGVSPEQRLILLFGWSPFIKGVDVGVKAFRRLQADGESPYVLGVVCGRTYTKEKMADFIQEKTGSAPEKGILLLEPVEDVFRYHKASDIFLSASRSETFSYALLEAMYSKKPCVVSDIPGVRWAMPYESVLPFPSEDDEALCEQLRLAGGVSREVLEDTAGQVRKTYSIDRWINGILAVYGPS